MDVSITRLQGDHRLLWTVAISINEHGPLIVVIEISEEESGESMESQHALVRARAASLLRKVASGIEAE